jgi:hypothetical protein
MTNELERTWKEAVVALSYHPAIFLEELWKEARKAQPLSKPTFEQGPPQYEAGVITTWPRCSVRIMIKPEQALVLRINRSSLRSSYTINWLVASELETSSWKA